MAGSRPARSHAGNSAGETIRKQVNAVSNMRAAGYDPEAFIIRERPTNRGDIAKAVQRFFDAPKPGVPIRSTAQLLASVPRAPIARQVQNSQGDVWASAKAAVRGGADSLPFSMADRISAAVLAARDAVNGQSLDASYDKRFAAEQAQDRYDQKIHPVARTVGTAVGTGAQFLLPGGAFVKGGTRIAEVAPILGRELAALAAIGGGAGVGEQAVSDYVTGKRSSFGDYAGSFVGGGIGAVVARDRSARTAGSVAGASTSIAQDLFNGRPVNWNAARESIAEAGALARVGGIAGQRWAEGRSIKTKEALGETGSRIRTILRGDRTASTAKSRLPLDKGYTIPDQRTVGKQYVESKFGRTARLSTAQKRAYAQPGLDYRVDHFLPKDVGASLGLPLGYFGSPFGREPADRFPQTWLSNGSLSNLFP